jgi:polyphosphate:AMP phosphotransferase
MFETAELGRKVSRSEYEQAVPGLRADLLRVQNELRLNPDFSVVVVIAGVDGAGKGETVNLLHAWMDPRYLEAHAFGPPSNEEAERPPLWRFWRVLPAQGRIGIFFGSWYTDPILRRVYGESDDAELATGLARVNAFERQLVDGNTLVLKFWFHLAKAVQKKRLESLSKDKKQAWRVTKQDWKHYKLYDRFLPVCEQALRETSTGEAPWTLVEGTDSRYRELTVGRHILEAIAERLEKSESPPAQRTVLARVGAPRQATLLDSLDLGKRLAPEGYREKLEALQARLNVLSRRAQERGVSALFAFEGWDGAGKGGVIRRITEALDARFYNVLPIAAPSDEELAHPYLWRFWRHLPRAGHLTVFDRSWYGRVLVERVEGLARPEEWRRAYKEINEFEGALAEHGYALAKFWLHIDKDEQARRFAEREQTAYKKYKITPEDYRNREKWDLYEGAVNEMVERTSTSHAPWTLVEANDKRHARVKVLGVCCRALEDAIDRAKGRD